jgi:alpha(1,3/1,4) fucosyltransferase
VKRSISIDFCDFHPNFPKTDNFYYHLLRERFDVRLCDQPDYLLFGPYGHEHRLHSSVRILLSIEPGVPDFETCDYSVTCLKIDDPRHFQLPVYATNGKAAELIRKDESAERILADKTRFCSFVVSNQHPTKNRNRAELFEKLSRYKPVDSGGRYRNNIGGAVPGGSQNKIAFLRAYKFNIAFENSSLPGYTTEKLYEAMAARSLPLYWGNPLIAEEFNPRSFLNCADFPSLDALVERVIELDRNDAKYLEYLRQPYFHGNEANRHFDYTRLLDFFEKVFAQQAVPVAQRRKRKSLLGRWIPVKRHHWHPLPSTPSPPGSNSIPVLRA